MIRILYRFQDFFSLKFLIKNFNCYDLYVLIEKLLNVPSRGMCLEIAERCFHHYVEYYFHTKNASVWYEVSVLCCYMYEKKQFGHFKTA